MGIAGIAGIGTGRYWNIDRDDPRVAAEPHRMHGFQALVVRPGLNRFDTAEGYYRLYKGLTAGDART